MIAVSHNAQPSAGKRLKLYVAGASPRSRRAIENLQRIVESMRSPCEVEVIDVLQFPDLAERERVLATPTLLKESPLPRRRITGDLSDLEQVLRIIAPDTAESAAPSANFAPAGLAWSRA